MYPSYVRVFLPPISKFHSRDGLKSEEEINKKKLLNAVH